MFRDARLVANVTDESERWLLADNANSNLYRLGMHPSMYKSDTSCTQQMHYTTRTHHVDTQVTDQFYLLRQSTLKRHLEQTGMIVPNTLKIGTRQYLKDENIYLQTIRATGFADQALISLLIYDVN